MQAAFTPVETCPAEWTLGSCDRFNIDTEIGEKPPAFVGDESRTIRKDDVAVLAKGICQCDAKTPGYMIVTGPRRP